MAEENTTLNGSKWSKMMKYGDVHGNQGLKVSLDRCLDIFMEWTSITSRQVMHWIPLAGKQERRKERQTDEKWIDAIDKDLEVIYVTWDASTQLAVDQLK